MKASIENGNIEMDADAIKAIRFVCGYTTDLRIKLKNTENTIWTFLDDNYVNLFGYDAYREIPKATDPDWDKWERMMNRAVRKIMEG